MLRWITASNSTLTGISKCDQMAVWLFRCIFFQCVNVAALRARSFLFLKDKKAPKLRIKYENSSWRKCFTFLLWEFLFVTQKRSRMLKHDEQMESRESLTAAWQFILWLLLMIHLSASYFQNELMNCFISKSLKWTLWLQPTIALIIDWSADYLRN